MKIRIEVIPIQCTGRNLHSHDILRQRKWEEISQGIRKLQKCECCEKKFEEKELHAHEVWEFDPKEQVQRLKQIICVCTKCHQAIHYNFLLSNQSLTNREAFIAKAHYMEINGKKCDEKRFEHDLNEALHEYRCLNQKTGTWKLDISYVIKAGFVVYEEINLENLEKLAPGSEKYLKPYSTKPKLYFNNIPKKCLIDMATAYHKKKTLEPCELCGKQDKILYTFYDLRVKKAAPEMLLVGTRKICKLCRKTIYYGAHKHFMKYRKTTRHYMKVNQCSYKECVEAARMAKRLIDMNSMVQLFVYLKTPKLPAEEFRMRSQYLYDNGARFNPVYQMWYLRPVRYLWKFKSFL